MSEHESFEKLVLDAMDIVLCAVRDIPGARYSPEQLKAWREAKLRFSLTNSSSVTAHRRSSD